MSALQDEIKRILEEMTRLRYSVRYFPDLDDPKWDVLMDECLSMIMPPYEGYEAILSVLGYSNGDVMVKPKMINSLKRLAEKLNHRQVGSFLLVDRYDWIKAQKNFPSAIAFLRDMDKLASEVNY